MARIEVRRRLLRDGFVVLAAYLVYHAISMAVRYGIGWDAHAYYVAWDGGLYEGLPGTLDAYNYSPLFAQLTWPLTLLPWPVFCALLIGAAAVGVGWLVRPLPPVTAVAWWLFCTPEILSGNVFWLLAVATVLGFTRGGPWCVAAYTKVLPCLGPVWFLVRREWRLLGGFILATLVLLAASVAVSPGEWADWVHFLRDSAGDSNGFVYLTPAAIYFPLLARLPIALALVVFAALTERRWLVPVCMVLASPVVGWGTFALLAAIPRLRDPGPVSDAERGQVAGRTTARRVSP
ncbi:DUF2029 domain-containing protein [Nocardioides agariphilus]|jgi:hypothetical protein|uniref:DUF2029 domain-containing protein n=1 Tax=Nocardioides agariphilus TaxID=433664 RepID=A0A930YJB7_9ACTN|nr:glycosyltransferase family 87 protein [Nocardioides agariphilus]MBF4769003.1 DUF2029 domain-containing protein [Nocardioides agariphilus]